MPPIPSDIPVHLSEPGDESAIIRDLRSQIAAMKADLTPIYAGTAIIKKKGQQALEFEASAREGLINAWKALKCE